jgi:hypothetical protein
MSSNKQICHVFVNTVLNGNAAHFPYIPYDSVAQQRD